MKKHILLIAILSLFIIGNAVSADSISKEAAACRDLGILIGSDANGVTADYLKTTPNRAQAFLILLRMKGLENEAIQISDGDNFPDADSAPWARSYLLYAKKKPELGWVGKPDGSFAPNDKIDSKAFYKVMLEGLGYRQDIDFKYHETIDFAANIGLIQNKSKIDSLKIFTVADVAEGIYNALNTNIKDTNKKLIELLCDEKIITHEQAVNAGFEMPSLPINIKSFKVLTNNKLELELDEGTIIKNSDISITSLIDNTNLKVLSISYNNYKAVVLTEEAKSYCAYELKIRAYKTTYVALPKDTVKPLADIEITGNSEITVFFNEEMDRESTQNLSNYIIKNDLPILTCELDNSGKILTIKTIEQKEGNFYWLIIQNVQDLSGNSIEKFEKTFIGIAKDYTKPYIEKAISTTNKSIEVTFNKKLNKTTAQYVSNYKSDNNLYITNAILKEDGKTISLSTSTQIPSKLYTLTIQNIADTFGNVIDKNEIRLVGCAGDSIKPTAKAVTISNTEILVTFSEKVDKSYSENTNNYSIDKNISIEKCILDEKQESVTIITTRQTPGIVYTLTISKILDIFGNEMETHTVMIGGMLEKAAKLSYSATASSNKVFLTFNKCVEKRSAENVLNYTIDNGLGYPIKAILDETSKVVTLETAPQTNGKIYSLTAKDIYDLTGTKISSSEEYNKINFIGSATSANGTISLQTVITINNNTIDLVFDTELTDEDIEKLSVKIDDLSSNVSYKKYTYDKKNILRLQFKTESSNNPDLFKSGKIYKLEANGIDRLKIENNTNILYFAGTIVPNPIPRLTDAVALNSTALLVIFSEPVTGLTKDSFKIDDRIDIDGISVSQNDITDRATLYIDNFTPLKYKEKYKVYPKSNIKDGGGYNTVLLKTDSEGTYYQEFKGTSTENIPPYIKDINVIDKYTLLVSFSEAVKNIEKNNFDIECEDSSNDDLFILNIRQSDDKSELTIYLDCESDSFQSGEDYILEINSRITDMQNLSAEPSDREEEFDGKSYSLDEFKVLAYNVSEDRKFITLALNREISPVNPEHDWLDIITDRDNKNICKDINISNDKRQLIIELKEFDDRATYIDIELTDKGKSYLRDLNNQILNLENYIINL